MEEILLVKAYSVLRYDNSLLGRVLSRIPGVSRVEFSCIPPECRGGRKRIGPSTFL